MLIGPNEHTPQIAKTVPSTGKVTATIYWSIIYRKEFDETYFWKT